MTTRSRNGILFFLQDATARESLMEAARADGWDAFAATDIHEALRLFGEIGEGLALVVTDDMAGQDEGRRRGLMGINFLLQRSVHMFNANIPFVVLMFTRSRSVKGWANSVEGWTVAMPKETGVLLELFNRLEHERKLPPKSKSRSGEL